MPMPMPKARSLVAEELIREAHLRNDGRVDLQLQVEAMQQAHAGAGFNKRQYIGPQGITAGTPDGSFDEGHNQHLKLTGLHDLGSTRRQWA